MFNRRTSGCLGFNETHGLWQIVLLRREELEFFCPAREMAFAA
jgi:hypothetical protein